MNPTLTVSDLTIAFGNRPPVVDLVSFSVDRGETLALVGESGSGKTLCCRSVLQILPPTAKILSGDITFKGTERSRSDENALILNLAEATEKELLKVRGNRIAMVFQEPMRSMSPLHTIGNQVSEVLHLHSECDAVEAKSIVLDEFDEVGFSDPERIYNAYPFELSGGMLQRAGIAMATVAKPDLLIADEPTTALDMTTQALVLGLLKKMQKKSAMALILVTHDLGVVANLADKVVVMNRGRVVESGTATRVLRDPVHGYTRMLIDSAAHMPDTDDSSLDKTGADSESDAPIMELIDVSKTFKSRASVPWRKPEIIKAVNHVDISLKRGSTLAVVGESGSGKSTLGRIAMGSIAPDSGGRVLFRATETSKGVDVTDMDGEQLSAFRRNAQMVFQDPRSSLSPRMQIVDAICEPLEIHQLGTKSERIDKAGQLLERVGLDNSMMRRYPHAFSGGQRQRLSIARALALEPKLLILDEPTSALDVSVQSQILDLLEQLRDDLQLSYMFISHDLAVVARIADEIAVMRRGFIVERAPTDLLLAEPKHPYTRALIAAHPEPDINKKIDLNAVAQGAGEPDSWEDAFKFQRNEIPPLQQYAPGHWLRARM